MNNHDVFSEMFIRLGKATEYDAGRFKSLLNDLDKVEWYKKAYDAVSENTVEDLIANYLVSSNLTNRAQFTYAYDDEMLVSFRSEQHIGKWFWVLVPGKLKASGQYDGHIAQLREIGSNRGYFTYVLYQDGTEYVAYLKDADAKAICEAAGAIATELSGTKAFLMGDEAIQARFDLFHSQSESMALAV